jgi:hypothetical protein
MSKKALCPHKQEMILPLPKILGQQGSIVKRILLYLSLQLRNTWRSNQVKHPLSPQVAQQELEGHQQEHINEENQKYNRKILKTEEPLES